MKRSNAGLTFFVGILISILLAGCGSSSDNTAVVAVPDNAIRTTQFGAVQGVNDASGSGTYSWLGIPFAAPPVGALRWRAPVDPAGWSGTLAPTKLGNPCVQHGRI